MSARKLVDTETSSTAASYGRRESCSTRSRARDAGTMHVTQRVSNRPLVDRMAAMDLNDQAEIMQRIIQRASAAFALHNVLQPRGSAAPSAELAWDTVRTFWYTGVVPPLSIFGVWTLLPPTEWVRLHHSYNALLCRSYAIYCSRPHHRPHEESLLCNLHLLRFSIVGALLRAPESYAAAVAGAIIDSYRNDDEEATNARVTEAAARIELTPQQLEGMSAAWGDFTETMAAISADVALLQGTREKVAAAAKHAEKEAGESKSSMPATAKAMFSRSDGMAAEAMARCNARGLTAHLTLALAILEDLEWFQYLELLSAAGDGRLDYLLVMPELLARSSGSIDDTFSAVGDNSV